MASSSTVSGDKVVVVDLGTTYFKVCRFDMQGRLEASKTVPTPVKRRNKLLAEIDPGEFRRCLVPAIQDVAAFGDQQGAHVRAVTFATQANSFALLDSARQPLTPFILWSDLRAQGTEFPLLSLANTSEFHQTTGVASLNHLFLPAKLHWLQENLQHIWARTRGISFLSDYFTSWLTGRSHAELATAALSGLVDIRRGQWWPKAYDAAQVPVQWLPELARAGTDVGPVLPAVADELGISRDCRFVVGCLDQHAGAIGADNVTPGGVSETTGTVLATVRCMTSSCGEPVAPGVFRGPAFSDDLYYEMVFSEQSAGILETFRSAAAPHLSFAELDGLAAESPSGARGLRLHPSAFGQSIDQLFVGLGPQHSLGDKVRAILEGIADELATQVRRLCGDKLPDVIHAAGGGSKSELWLTIKSQRLGVPVKAVECTDPTALGGARLAITALHQ